MRRILPVFGVVLIVAAMFAPMTEAGPVTGKRSVVVTVRNDATGEKLRYPFTLSDTDRLYVTRIEAEVVHTADGTSSDGVVYPAGTSEEVVYPTGYRFGNVTVTRVQR